LALHEDNTEFRVLGPFEVSRGGQPLDVGAGKQRALLALLVLRAGEIVSTDRLIDALWGEQPPASALNSVHIYVSQLRKALGNGRLETHGRGYLLALESDEVDLDRFERLLGEGRALLAAGDPHAAAQTLGTALALWRGEPLSDFAFEPFAQSEIVRLEELHLAALEERIDADFALGRHAELVPELETLVREHPLRERLRAQLMLALYRSGRQAEALDTYRHARRLLAEELGLEPGRALQELERAILRQDAALDPPARASGTLAKVSRRSGVLIAVGAALLLSAAVAVAGIELSGDDGPGLASASANSVAAIDVGSNRLVADVPVGNGPTSVTAGAGAVWVTNAQDGSVSRLDTESGTVVQRIDVGGDPSGVAFGAGAVWVANSRDGTVSRIDPQTNREVQSITVGVTPTALAFGNGALWVTDAQERNVRRIDVARGRSVKRIPTGALGRGIVFGGGSVWVTDESSRSVVRIDARRGTVVEAVGVGEGPTGVAFGNGSVWVANSLDGTVSRIDADTNRVTATVDVGEGPDSIAVGGDTVWVSGEFSEQIVRIDPAENRVVERIPVANRPKGIALSQDRVWFGAQSSGDGHRGGRLIVDEAPVASIDPSYMTWWGNRVRLTVAYDGLVGYARRGGSEGLRRVPNLAVSLPTVTAGETRYAFRLRRGIRYSNGTPVRATDFRRAAERSFLGGGQVFQISPLVGIEACRRRPRSCDLSRAIRTDDATGTIVFHLQRPESRFLREELPFLPPIPAETPDRDQGTRPIPSTGPYMIESYVPERALTLVRNPHFRVWSRLARPDGFADEIVFRDRRKKTGDTAGMTAVERGQFDLTFAPPDPEVFDAFDRFKARHASQVHSTTDRATVVLFLNAMHPPFDDVNVRRAVNFAVDRAAIAAASGGPSFAQPTCQPRPPDTEGFRRHCPYTAAPASTGEWRAPDLARARRLVAASGTRGTTVTVWTYPGFWEPAAQGAVRALRDLGYRARVGLAKDNETWFAKVSDEKTRGVQAGVTGWYGIPRAASSLLEIFLCGSIDLTFFCDRRIDARIARALDLQSSDPDASVPVWTQLERDIVHLAPWVPLFTPSGVALVSKRVGNYQNNPELGVLLDQLWVR
jgi:YVTN family beta-propeller protein